MLWSLTILTVDEGQVCFTLQPQREAFITHSMQLVPQELRKKFPLHPTQAMFHVQLSSFSTASSVPPPTGLPTSVTRVWHTSWQMQALMSGWETFEGTRILVITPLCHRAARLSGILGETRFLFIALTYLPLPTLLLPPLSSLSSCLPSPHSPLASPLPTILFLPPPSPPPPPTLDEGPGNSKHLLVVKVRGHLCT